MRMRVADYITSKLFDAGGECVFLITGGMIMHLTDAYSNTDNKNMYVVIMSNLQ